MNGRHALRRYARRRMIDLEQKIHVAALAEDDVGFDAQVARGLACGRSDRKTGQRWSRGERAGCFHKATSADSLHLPYASCPVLTWRRSYATLGLKQPNTDFGGSCTRAETLRYKNESYDCAAS